ncbi:hypothetical protein WJX74_004891 [Apatococcus lobatus]|uniref:Uncharacterized protein n=1 Tax=Apatococcus lobatus TaxID=904363 RepID=A0AAW1Q8E2_9CHLO
MHGFLVIPGFPEVHTRWYLAFCLLVESFLLNTGFLAPPASLLQAGRRTGEQQRVRKTPGELQDGSPDFRRFALHSIPSYHGAEAARPQELSLTTVKPGRAKALLNMGKDATAISGSNRSQASNRSPQLLPGLSVRINALKKTFNGGPSFSLVMNDIAKQRHRRNPYSEKYLQLCLSSFAQEAAGEEDLGSRAIAEDAANNMHVRIELIKSMKASLVKQAQQALKQCTGPGCLRPEAKAAKKSMAQKKQSHQAAASSLGDQEEAAFWDHFKQVCNGAASPENQGLASLVSVLAKSPHIRTHKQLCFNLDNELRRPSFAQATSRLVEAETHRLHEEARLTASGNDQAIQEAIAKLQPGLHDVDARFPLDIPSEDWTAPVEQIPLPAYLKEMLVDDGEALSGMDMPGPAATLGAVDGGDLLPIPQDMHSGPEGSDCPQSAAPAPTSPHPPGTSNWQESESRHIVTAASAGQHHSESAQLCEDPSCSPPIQPDGSAGGSWQQQHGHAHADGSEQGAALGMKKEDGQQQKECEGDGLEHELVATRPQPPRAVPVFQKRRRAHLDQLPQWLASGEHKEIEDAEASQDARIVEEAAPAEAAARGLKPAEALPRQQPQPSSCRNASNSRFQPLHLDTLRTKDDIAHGTSEHDQDISHQRHQAWIPGPSRVKPVIPSRRRILLDSDDDDQQTHRDRAEGADASGVQGQAVGLEPKPLEALKPKRQKRVRQQQQLRQPLTFDLSEANVQRFHPDIVMRLPASSKRHFKPVADVESLLLQPSGSAKAAAKGKQSGLGRGSEVGKGAVPRGGPWLPRLAHGADMFQSGLLLSINLVELREKRAQMQPQIEKALCAMDPARGQLLTNADMAAWDDEWDPAEPSGSPAAKNAVPNCMATAHVHASPASPAPCSPACPIYFNDASGDTVLNACSQSYQNPKWSALQNPVPSAFYNETLPRLQKHRQSNNAPFEVSEFNATVTSAMRHPRQATRFRPQWSPAAGNCLPTTYREPPGEPRFQYEDPSEASEDEDEDDPFAALDRLPMPAIPPKLRSLHTFESTNGLQQHQGPKDAALSRSAACAKNAQQPTIPSPQGTPARSQKAAPFPAGTDEDAQQPMITSTEGTPALSQSAEPFPAGTAQDCNMSAQVEDTGCLLVFNDAIDSVDQVQMPHSHIAAELHVQYQHQDSRHAAQAIFRHEESAVPMTTSTFPMDVSNPIWQQQSNMHAARQATRGEKAAAPMSGLSQPSECQQNHHHHHHQQKNNKDALEGQHCQQQQQQQRPMLEAELSHRQGQDDQGLSCLVTFRDRDDAFDSTDPTAAHAIHRAELDALAFPVLPISQAAFKNFDQQFSNVDGSLTAALLDQLDLTASPAQKQHAEERSALRPRSTTGNALSLNQKEADFSEHNRTLRIRQDASPAHPSAFTGGPQQGLSKSPITTACMVGELPDETGLHPHSHAAHSQEAMLHLDAADTSAVHGMLSASEQQAPAAWTTAHDSSKDFSEADQLNLALVTSGEASHAQISFAAADDRPNDRVQPGMLGIVDDGCSLALLDKTNNGPRRNGMGTAEAEEIQACGMTDAGRNGHKNPGCSLVFLDELGLGDAVGHQLSGASFQDWHADMPDEPGSPQTFQHAQENNQEEQDDCGPEDFAQAISGFHQDSAAEQKCSRKRWREELHEQIIQDALQEKMQDTLSLEPLVQSIAKDVDALGSEPIPLEKLHRSLQAGSDNTTAETDSLQRSFVALLTVATHVNTGRLALEQHADDQQLLLTRNSPSKGVAASFARAR